jgi:hypothetical protein
MLVKSLLISGLKVEQKSLSKIIQLFSQVEVLLLKMAYFLFELLSRDGSLLLIQLVSLYGCVFSI